MDFAFSVDLAHAGPPTRIRRGAFSLPAMGASVRDAIPQHCPLRVVLLALSVLSNRGAGLHRRHRLRRLRCVGRGVALSLDTVHASLPHNSANSGNGRLSAKMIKGK
jgi:hypothetical protein